MVFSIFIYNRFSVTKKQKIIIEQKETETQEQNKIITIQKRIVEEKQKEILDSINYAKKIQYTLLAHDNFLKSNLNDFFVFFMPKDIVSGDFYWATKNGNRFYFAVCDSTGHGVPGAFMSLLNINFINEAINEKEIYDPDKIFNYVRNRLIESFKNEGQKDGFDGILICIEDKQPKITYSAANNHPIIIRDRTIIKLPADKMPVGPGILMDDFQKYEINFQKGDMLYLYSDGFADQFGGPKGKKFKYQQLNDLISKISHLPPEEQKNRLKNHFLQWKGDLEQVDDVCVFGMSC
jgi:serine phosphatase RsbU (regulator of sigma subunit)